METPNQLKKEVIVPLLDQLRQQNASIGQYEMSVMNSDYEYSVKLTNGKIVIANELVDHFEQNQSSISVEEYKRAARKFVQSKEVLTQEVVVEKKKTTTAVWVLTVAGLSIAVSAFLLFYLAPHLKAQKAGQMGQQPVMPMGNAPVTDPNAVNPQQQPGQTTKPTTPPAPPQTVAEVKGNIGKYVYARASESDYSKMKLGGVYGLKVTVHNDSDFPIDKVVVKVDYIKQDATIFKSEKVTYTNIAPHKTLTEKAPDSNRGTRVSTGVVSIQSAALGL